MLWKSFAVGATALIVFAAGWGPQIAPQAQAAGCDAGVRIDGSTADMAKQKMELAGYRQIHGLTKGCDNFWHGKATKDGAAFNIVLSPQGHVMTEGD
jgi:hypothetical protein